MTSDDRWSPLQSKNDIRMHGGNPYILGSCRQRSRCGLCKFACGKRWDADPYRRDKDRLLRQQTNVRPRPNFQLSIFNFQLIAFKQKSLGRQKPSEARMRGSTRVYNSRDIKFKRKVVPSRLCAGAFQQLAPSL